MKRLLPLVALLISVPTWAQDWAQWGYNTQHTSAVSYVSQALNQNLVNKVYDTLTQQEMAEAGALYGEPVLLAHFMTPLIDGDNVYMMCKTGTYSNRNYSTQKWGIMRLHWENGTLVELFDVPSGWNPPGSAFDFWEPVFHPVLANGYLYVPSGGGSILKIDKLTGITVSRINPFPTDDGGLKGNIFVLSPVTADGAGNLYYNAMQFTDNNNIYNNDVVDSWLVKVDKFDHYTAVSYSTLTTGAPKGTDLCENAFSTTQLPWPPPPPAQPGKVVCGTQRPGLNVAPAIAGDGTIYVATRAHLLSRETYLLAINPNLTQKWMASLRYRFSDGCNVPVSAGGTLPPNGAPGGCSVYGITGADPATNKPGGGRVLDDQSSTVTVAPDGSLFFGAYTRYNYAQGHLMHFDSKGNYLGAYKFGWDITAGIMKMAKGYSVLTKDNHYGETGSYCNDETFCPSANSFRPPDYPEGYFLTNLDPKTMTPIWSFKAYNHDSCSRDASGNVTCTPNTNPNGFEWCVNAWVIDAKGVSIANSEDGWLYALNPDGTERDKIFQQLALGAAYTPTSIGADGKVYSQNAGHLFVAGN